MDAIANVVVRRFGALGIAPQGQEVESASPNTSHLKPKREKRRQKAPNLANYQKAKQQGAFDVQITRDGCQ
jgi:hypothetical protein